MWQRAILHVDMDAFFASVEQLEDPSLRGRCVLVGSDRPRGVVAAASYEARKFGCRSALPMSIAKRLCPHAIIISGHYDRYRIHSQHIFAILNDFTPLVEPLSIDEAFCDVTASQRLFGDPVQIARQIRHRIRTEVGLTASVGVAPNKFIAKLASDMDKPDGLTIIRPADIHATLDPLPVAQVWGIGPKTTARLARMNIRTIGDLRKLDPQWLEKFFASEAQHYHNLANGLDDRPVVTDSQARQISQETTFEVDVQDPEIIRQIINGQAEQVARRLRRAQQKASAITLKIRFGDFQTITRSGTLPTHTDVTAEIWACARDLFDKWARQSYQPVRLIGVAAHRLGHGDSQLSLFTDSAQQKQQQLDKTLDSIVARLGKGSIQRGIRPARDH